jgi:hypothetical protein
MARKRPKPRARQPRTPRPEAAAPPWLVVLRQGLFGPGFPQVDPRYQVMDGSQVVCERRVEEQGPRLLYREIWRHPLTLEPVHSWWQELDHASFVGVPPYVFERSVTLARQCLQGHQEQWPRLRGSRAWTMPHERLGRQPRRAWP